MTFNPDTDPWGFSPSAPLIGSPMRQPPQTRRVDIDCSVTFLGRRWFIPAHYCPGDLVACLPTRKGVFLRIQCPHKSKPDILAVPADLAHNPQHKGRNSAGSDAHSGKPTRKLQAGSGSTVGRPYMPKQPRRAKAADSKRSHISGTAPLAPGADPIPIVLVLQLPACTSSCRKCRCRSPRS